MHELKIKYEHFKKQLVEENSKSSAKWNKKIKDAIDEMFKDVPEETKRLIKLNHI